MEVRDPLHGAIFVSDEEATLVDHPFVQRLRGIKQMGFSELPFPGAVHSRYIHSVGCLELAGRAFDACFRRDPFSSPARRAAFRQIVRVAALCHDLGHAPFSHCTEFAMPPLRTLGLTAYSPAKVAARLDRTASHEDYTIAILTRSSFAAAIERSFGFTGQHVAALVSHDVAAPDDFFVDNGLDFRRVLSQLISSELDVDRLDYLGRDSYFSGARYGQVDVNWILSSLEWYVDGGSASAAAAPDVSLALDHRAIYAFDDFMIARYHMFVMVYFHHKSVVFEEMLKRHFTGPACTYRFPGDAEAYLAMDDIHLHSYLREQRDEWARRIVERRPFRRALELHGSPDEVARAAEAVARLHAAGIETLSASSTGKLSRYSAMVGSASAPRASTSCSAPPGCGSGRRPSRTPPASSTATRTSVTSRACTSARIASKRPSRSSSPDSGSARPAHPVQGPLPPPEVRDEVLHRVPLADRGREHDGCIRSARSHAPNASGRARAKSTTSWPVRAPIPAPTSSPATLRSPRAGRATRRWPG